MKSLILQPVMHACSHCFVLFDLIRFHTSSLQIPEVSLPSLKMWVCRIQVYILYPTKQVGFCTRCPFKLMHVSVVAVPEELDRADCGSRCGEPAAALCQHAVWETHPHLCQQTQHCKTQVFVLFLIGFYLLPGTEEHSFFGNPPNL